MNEKSYLEIRIQIEKDALFSLSQIETLNELETWRINTLGRNGKVTGLLRGISDLPVDSRRKAGGEANSLKNLLTEKYESQKSGIENKENNVTGNGPELLDVTLPGRSISLGSLHPTTAAVREICQVFESMGFQTIEGPEVELDKYNFQKLNIPEEHPARDMWNSLWIDRELPDGSRPLLLRTHTSPMQIRTMESQSPPVRVVVPGKTYRYEATDATHEWQFCQIEGLAVDKDITFANLKATLEEFARRIFGDKRKARFRCDFFPFVEPGAEVSIDCFKCEGDGCRVCGNTGWIEIMGAGMVHPKVLAGVGYDPEIYSGFAWGMGAERIAMLKHGIDDIRHFYSNDMKFLKQFS
ncbi:MAG: phenylalanine--tRNA ligase subunit alpha [SAR202 cluster bacterium]|jgi:phenylalanyl-tRNA synthetase alpha chain|nr:phenylalanine--tRNA ligase subunit alpha [SAR202 cluster bacterium]HJO61181.1 phenylalanine--tRNA ligase subunit alpha [SAR202 cluster bacterium]|tara:strand:- start:33916 stop:34977 length:1062 start_codon:yes stop_codon:yes gene_type:complete